MTEIQRIQIEEVMANFDFFKVHRIMKLLDWEWIGIGIPTVPQLKKMVYHRLVSTINQALREKDTVTIASGGFEFQFDPVSGFLSLIFVLEECYNVASELKQDIINESGIHH